VVIGFPLEVVICVSFGVAFGVPLWVVIYDLS
jgi:hypothetical protein